MVHNKAHNSLADGDFQDKLESMAKEMVASDNESAKKIGNNIKKMLGDKNYHIKKPKDPKEARFLLNMIANNNADVLKDLIHLKSGEGFLQGFQATIERLIKSPPETKTTMHYIAQLANVVQNSGKSLA